MNLTTLTSAEIESILSQQPDQDPYAYFPTELLDGPPRPAAVLLPLLKTNGQWEVLFIRRTEVDGDYHSGQVALPGGAREAEDADNITAAIRETNEELGIQSADVEVLGTLNDFITISNYQVTPVIAEINWPLTLTLAPDEVARAFTLPLNWLADPANHEIRHRQLPNGLGNASVIYFNKNDGELLWGATARIIFEFLGVLGINFPDS
ncbi:MAG: CoA pyrophosphatase [Chloroflexota bacterium]